MTDRFKTFIVISLIIITGLSGWAFAKSNSATTSLSHSQITQNKVIAQQSKDREAAILKNVEARREDCESQNKLRAALRDQVETSQKQTPFILKLIPSFNQPAILKLAAQNSASELRAYMPLNCEVYAHRALPPLEQTKVTLAEQQNELHRLIAETLSGRVETVKQRCQLTKLLVTTTERFKLPEVAQYKASYTACAKQLHTVEKLAQEAN